MKISFCALFAILLIFSFKNAQSSEISKLDAKEADVSVANDTICENQWATLTATSSEPGTSFIWNTGYNGATLSISPSATTTYFVTATNPAGETSSASATVVVNMNPILEMVVSAETCETSNGSVTANVSGISTPYLFVWDPSGPGSYKLENLVSGNYSVTVTDVNGCVESESVFLPNIPSPIAGFTINPTVAILGTDPIQITDQSANSIGWEYDFGDGNIATFPSPVYLYTFPGTYIIKQMVYNSAGCVDSASISVKVIEETTVFIPNAFSPNGDNRNDVFRPAGLAIQPDQYLMQIFDRWGHKIFQSTDINQGWNGDVTGRKYNETSTEVFTYYISIIDSNGKNLEFYGTLLRMP